MKQKLFLLALALCVFAPLQSILAEPAKNGSSFPRPGDTRSPLPDDVVIAATKISRVVLPETKSGLARLGANAAAVLGQELSSTVPPFVLTDTYQAFSKAVAEDKLLVAFIVDASSPISQKQVQELASSRLLPQFKDCAVFVIADNANDKAATQLANGLNVTRVPVFSILVAKADHIDEMTQTVGFLDGEVLVQALKDGLLTSAASPIAPAALKANPVKACPALANAPAKLF